jgi:hypothetical protein
MTKSEQLEEAIRNIAERAGLGNQGVFHLTPLSRDSAGLCIMEIMRPEGAKLCDEIRQLVADFPCVTDVSCVPLLPEVGDKIIRAAEAVSQHSQPGRVVNELPRAVSHQTGGNADLVGS